MPFFSNGAADLDRLAQRMDSRDWTRQVQDRWSAATQPQPEALGGVPSGSLRVVDLPGERAQELLLRAAETMARTQGLKLRVDPVGTGPMGPNDLAVFTFGLGDPTEASAPAADQPDENVERVARADLGLVLDRIERSIERSREAAGVLFLVQGLTGERPRVQQAVRQALSERRLRSEGVRAMTVYADPGERLLTPEAAAQAPSQALADLPVMFPRADLRAWALDTLLGSGPALEDGKAALNAYFRYFPERFDRFEPDRSVGVGAHTWEAALPTIDALARSSALGSGERQAMHQLVQGLQTQVGGQTAHEVSQFVIQRAELALHLGLNLQSLTRNGQEITPTVLHRHPLANVTTGSGRGHEADLMLDVMGTTLARQIATAMTGSLAAVGKPLESSPKDVLTFASDHASDDGWEAPLGIMMHFARYQMNREGSEANVFRLIDITHEALGYALHRQGVELQKAQEIAGLTLAGGMHRMDKDGFSERLNLNVRDHLEKLIRAADPFAPRRLNLAEREARRQRRDVAPADPAAPSRRPGV